MNRWALITGATSGIGSAFARVLARHGHDLILVAPVAAEVDDFARELRAQHPVDVETIVMDVARPGAAQRIHDTGAGSPSGHPCQRHQPRSPRKVS